MPEPACFGEEGGSGCEAQAFAAEWLRSVQHHSLLNMAVKPQGGPVFSWLLAPRSTPNGNLEVHIWIHAHMLQQALQISGVCLVSEPPFTFNLGF